MIFNWDSFLHYLLHPGPMVIHGLWLTIILTIASEFFGVVIGVLAAMARLSSIRILSYLSFLYSWAIRGTPQLLLISIVYFAGIPFFGLQIFGGYKWGNFDLFGIAFSGPVLAGVFALSINEGAYMSEFVRGAVGSVDSGQTEAALSIGMTHGGAMRRIILPQAARVLVPVLGNQVNVMLKTTSLLSVISVTELYTAATIIQGQTFQPFEVYGAAAIYYIGLSTIWALVQRMLEKRVNRGWATPRSASPKQKRFAGRARLPEREGVL